MPENKTPNARQTVEELVYAVGVAESEGQTDLAIFASSAHGDSQRATTTIIDAEGLFYQLTLVPKQDQKSQSESNASIQDLKRYLAANVDIARLDGDAGKAERFEAFLTTVNELATRPAGR